MQARLIVQDGNQKGRSIPLPETIFLIGRDAQCHLRPHCPLVSKLHCAIAAWAGQIRVRDLKSRNGTALNGRPIDGEALVHDGDRLQIGSLSFVFAINRADGTPQQAPIEEGELRWLLEVVADKDTLSIGAPTRVVVSDYDGESATGHTAAPRRQRSSKVVSAGQHLRDYFHQQRPQR